MTVIFHIEFWISTSTSNSAGVLTALFSCYMADATWNCSRLGAFCVGYTIQPCTMSPHFMQSHIRRMYACLAVTCQLNFWQHDRDLLRATAAVTREWNGYENKSQHKRFNLVKKIIPPLLLKLEPAIFRSGTLITELSPLLFTRNFTGYPYNSAVRTRSPPF